MPVANSNYAGNNGRANGNHNGNYNGMRNGGYGGNYNGNSNYDRSSGNGGARGGYNNSGRGNYNGYGNGGGQREDFTYEIAESYGVLSISSTGWTKELNRVSWNGNAPKFDIREWSPDHGRMRRGVTFTEEEALELRDLLEIAISGLPISAFSEGESDPEQNGDEASGGMYENTPGLDAGPLIDDAEDAESSHDAA